MRVFNLTERYIDYRGKVLKPFGSDNYPDMDYVPTRDLALQKSKVLAFGSLPKGWVKPPHVPRPAKPPAPAAKEQPKPVSMSDALKSDALPMATPKTDDPPKSDDSKSEKKKQKQ